MLLLIPDLSTAATVVGSAAHLSATGAVVAAAAAVTAALQPNTRLECEWNAPVCGAMAALICLAAHRAATVKTGGKRGEQVVGVTGWALRVAG